MHHRHPEIMSEVPSVRSLVLLGIIRKQNKQTNKNRLNTVFSMQHRSHLNSVCVVRPEQKTPGTDQEKGMMEQGACSGLQVGMSTVVAMPLKIVFLPESRHGAVYKG